MDMTIRDNLIEVRRTIEHAARRAGRVASRVRLVAVSKNQTVEAIREACDAGQLLFGENRIQEAENKIHAMRSDIEWHLIGHLQTNKARSAVRLFDMIHSIDSLKLVMELDKRAKLADACVTVLIQVNVSGEESKFGLAEGDILPVIDWIMASQHLQLSGLMTIPPFSMNPEDSRPVFRGLRRLAEKAILDRGILEESELELSMGMSSDYWIAIEEGATLVRVGTAIFGER
ncbi:YggS family pyridoxal phosphate-dependent enzyme [bacterium]|nr:YggS family pyridoxal phosphate-dependent enzyme [candidate division CSSED10-310 bacterium]